MEQNNVWAGRRQAFAEMFAEEPLWFRISSVIVFAWGIGALVHGIVWMLQNFDGHHIAHLMRALHL
jgi:hypothetical protein